MLWLLLSSLAWADPVMIEAEGPGVVRVRAAEGVVYMPACGGVSWERFDPEAKVFLPIPGLPCGPLSAVLKVGPDGVEATLKAVLPPALEGGFMWFGQSCSLPESARTTSHFRWRDVKGCPTTSAPIRWSTGSEGSPCVGWSGFLYKTLTSNVRQPIPPRRSRTTT